MRGTKVRLWFAALCLCSEHVVTRNNIFCHNLVICTDNGEMKDILEEAGVKSVSISVQVCSFSSINDKLYVCSCLNFFGLSEKDTEKEVPRRQL